MLGFRLAKWAGLLGSAFDPFVRWVAEPQEEEGQNMAENFPSFDGAQNITKTHHFRTKIKVRRRRFEDYLIKAVTRLKLAIIHTKVAGFLARIWKLCLSCLCVPSSPILVD